MSGDGWQELALFAPEGLPDVAANLQPRVTPEEYPHLVEMMSWLVAGRGRDAYPKGAGTFDPAFESGLALILDGLERLRRQ